MDFLFFSERERKLLPFLLNTNSFASIQKLQSIIPLRENKDKKQKKNAKKRGGRKKKKRKKKIVKGERQRKIIDHSRRGALGMGNERSSQRERREIEHQLYRQLLIWIELQWYAFTAMLQSHGGESMLIINTLFLFTCFGLSLMNTDTQFVTTCYFFYRVV